MSSNRPEVVWYKCVPEPWSARGWTRQDWIRYAEGFRPAGYKGGIEDEAAYKKWCDEEMYEAIVRDFDVITANNWLGSQRRHKHE